MYCCMFDGIHRILSDSELRDPVEYLNFIFCTALETYVLFFSSYPVFQVTVGN